MTTRLQIAAVPVADHEAQNAIVVPAADAAVLRLMSACRGICIAATRHRPTLQKVVADSLQLVGTRSTGGCGLSIWLVDGVLTPELAVPEAWLVWTGAECALDHAAVIAAELVHQAAHVSVAMAGKRHLSRRYHSVVFGTHAEDLGLIVVRSRGLGSSPGLLTTEARDRLRPELEVLADALVLAKASVMPPSFSSMPPTMTMTETGPAVDRYVYPRCECKTSRGRRRAIRVGRESWAEQSIHCRICGMDFTDNDGGTPETSLGTAEVASGTAGIVAKSQPAGEVGT